MTDKKTRELKDHFWRYYEKNEAKITEFHEALKQGNLKLRSLDEIADFYQQTLENIPEGDLAVFAYGSLLWNPAITVKATRPGVLADFHRRFCLHMTSIRACEKTPGLMLALEPQLERVCHGRLIFIDEILIHEELPRLWLREMSGMSYLPCWQNVKTNQGNVRALVFKVNPESPRYLGALSLAEQAERIAFAQGSGGDNYDYLFNLYDQLNKMEIEDQELMILVKEVQKLRKMHGLEMHSEALFWPW